MKGMDVNGNLISAAYSKHKHSGFQCDRNSYLVSYDFSIPNSYPCCAIK